MVFQPLQNASQNVLESPHDMHFVQSQDIKPVVLHLIFCQQFYQDAVEKKTQTWKIMENLRSERILNGIENLESLNATLSQSLWSVHSYNNQSRLGSIDIGSSTESLLTKRTSTPSLGELPSPAFTTSATSLSRLRANFKSMGSVDFETACPSNLNRVSLGRTSSAGRLNERTHSLCEMASESGLLGNTQSALAHLSPPEETEYSDLTSKSGQPSLAHDKILPPELTSLCRFSDDSGTDGSDTNIDDSRVNDNTPRHRKFSNRGRGILAYLKKKLSDPGYFPFKGGGDDSSARCLNRQEESSKFLSLSFPGSSYPLISVSSRSPSPKFDEKLTQESGCLPITNKDATPTAKDVAAPKMDMLKILDTTGNIMTKRHSVGSLGEPELQQLSFNTLPSPRRISQLLASHNSSSHTTSKLHKSRSRSDSCLLSKSHGSYFDVVYVKDPHPPNYTKPNVATVKEEEEALTSSDHSKLKEESTTDDSTAKEHEIAAPPRYATKSKVMFSELTEVHSFIQESAESEVAESEVDSKPNKCQLGQAWRPITSIELPSESPTESFQVDTSLPGEPKVDTSHADERLQLDASIDVEGSRDGIIELEDVEIQLVKINLAKPPERSKPIKPLSMITETTDTHSDSLPASNLPASKPPVSKPPASRSLATPTEQLVHYAPTRTAGPLTTLPPVRRASRFPHQRPKREHKLKQQPVNPSKSVRELSRMFEGPAKSLGAEPVLLPPFSPTAAARNKVSNGKSTTSSSGAYTHPQITATKSESIISSPPADLAGKRASPTLNRKESLSPSKIPTPISPRMSRRRSRVITSSTNRMTVDGTKLVSSSSLAHDTNSKQRSPETKSAATGDSRSPRNQRSKRNSASPTTKPKPARDVPARTKSRNGISFGRDSATTKVASSGASVLKSNCNSCNNVDFSSREHLSGSRADAVNTPLPPGSTHTAHGEDTQSVPSDSYESQLGVPEARTIFRPRRLYGDNKFDDSTTLRRKILKQHYSVADIDTVLKRSHSSMSSRMPHSHSQTFRSTHEWMNFGASLPLKEMSKNLDKKRFHQERQIH